MGFYRVGGSLVDHPLVGPPGDLTEADAGKSSCADEGGCKELCPRELQGEYMRSRLVLSDGGSSTHQVGEKIYKGRHTMAKFLHFVGNLEPLRRTERILQP